MYWEASGVHQSPDCHGAYRDLEPAHLRGICDAELITLLDVLYMYHNFVTPAAVCSVLYNTAQHIDGAFKMTLQYYYC